MRVLSFVVAAGAVALSHAHFCIFFYDSNAGTNVSYALPFEANIPDIENWYRLGDPAAVDPVDNSFNALTTPIDYRVNMTNRATVLSVSTAGGHDENSDQAFGLVFGSTLADSPAGSASLRCHSTEWIGRRTDPIRVQDDPEDTLDFDLTAGNAVMEFSWPAGETDGFLIFDIAGSMVCHFLESTGLTETVGLFDDVPENATTDHAWVASPYNFEDGVRLEIHKSCSGGGHGGSGTDSLDTSTAMDVDFTRIEGSNGDGTAAGYFWYNATSGYLTWQIEISGFGSSQVSAIEVRDGAEVVVSLGSTDSHYFQLTGSVMLDSAVGAALDAGEYMVYIVTSDNGDELVGTVNAQSLEDSAMRAGVAVSMSVLALTVASSLF